MTLHTTVYFPGLRSFTCISAPTFFNSVCVYTVSYSTVISTSVSDLIFHVCSISDPVSSAFNIFTCISAPTSLNSVFIYIVSYPIATSTSGSDFIFHVSSTFYSVSFAFIIFTSYITSYSLHPHYVLPACQALHSAI